MIRERALIAKKKFRTGEKQRGTAKANATGVS
jgi:hypothetical protein